MRPFAMLAIVLTFLASALVLRGPLVSGATVEPGTDTTVQPSARLDRHGSLADETVVRRSASADAGLPDLDRIVSRVLQPGETARSLTYENWRAVADTIPADRQYEIERIVTCETGGTWDTTLVGLAGEQGVAQVMPQFFGTVPHDLKGQLRQANAIAEANGYTPWTTRNGCPMWSAR